MQQPAWSYWALHPILCPPYYILPSLPPASPNTRPPTEHGGGVAQEGLQRLVRHCLVPRHGKRTGKLPRLALPVCLDSEVHDPLRLVLALHQALHDGRVLHKVLHRLLA